MESGRSFSSPSAPFCWKSTWTWSPVTSTELPGANHMVTTPNPPVFSRRPWPTQIFHYHPAPHHCVLQGQCQLNVPMCVVLSNTQTRMTNRRFVYTFGLRPKDHSCHHEVWLHLDFVENQYAHEPRGNHEQRVLLKEWSCPYPPDKQKGRYDDESDRSFSSLSSVRELVLP